MIIPVENQTQRATLCMTRTSIDSANQIQTINESSPDLLNRLMSAESIVNRFSQQFLIHSLVKKLINRTAIKNNQNSIDLPTRHCLNQQQP